MQITTGRIWDGPRLEREGWKVLNITVKSGTGVGRLFAPTWPMVMGWKRGDLDEEGYTDLFVPHMRESYRRHQNEWHQLLQNHEKIALLCYCKKGAFCHRHLVKEMLRKVGNKIGVPVEIIPER